MSVKTLAQWMARRPIRDRASRRKGRAAPASLLGELLGELEGEIGTEGPVSEQTWQELVGTRIADRSKPMRIDPAGTLIVHVPDSVWSQELSLLSSTIVARLCSMGVKVTGLRFIVGRVKPPRRGPTHFEHRKVAAAVELPQELKAEMESIEDPALRAALGEAAACSLAEKAADERRSARQRRKREFPRR